MPDPEPYPAGVLITGGSGGIGAALCRRAARAGWHVWIGYNSAADRAERLARELRADGGSARAIAIPLEDPERTRAAARSLDEDGIGARAVVLCGAPAPEVAALFRLDPEQFRRQFECAVIGSHALLAELWRGHFRPHGGGHVMAVLSAALGPPPVPHMAGYVVAKGALEVLLRAAAVELGRAGLRVSFIRPGYVETAMLSAFEPLLLDRARQAAPGGRFLSPDDVARALMRGLERPPAAGAIAELDLEPVGA